MTRFQAWISISEYILVFLSVYDMTPDREKNKEYISVSVYEHAPEMAASLSINVTKMNSKDYASVEVCLSKNYASVAEA